MGWTDVIANNYNATTTQNNGSCTYDTSQQSYQLLGSSFPTVQETSGLIYDNGFVLSNNDSGNAAKLFSTYKNSILLKNDFFERENSNEVYPNPIQDFFYCSF